MPVFGLVGMVIGMNPPESVPWEHILYGVGFTAGSSTRGGLVLGDVFDWGDCMTSWKTSSTSSAAWKCEAASSDPLDHDFENGCEIEMQIEVERRLSRQ